MNRPTQQLKRTLAERYPYNIQPPQSTQSRQPHSTQKYMEHFQLINKTPTTLKSDPNQNQQKKFTQALKDYSSKSSPIDSILGINQDALHTTHPHFPLCPPPKVPQLKDSTYEAIRTIHEIFVGKELKENQYDQNTLLVIEQYSEMLKEIGRRDPVRENKILAKSKAIVKDPTYQELQIKEIQTDPREFVRRPQQTKRKDVILMELIRQKKRKNFAPDYFPIMEMKLMQLLDFILQDQDDYIGLDPATKIKEVLKNLQQFQGKGIEGESKINLLRIFFQEFTSLKREKDQIQTMNTPMKKVQNKQKPPSSTKFKQTKGTVKQTSYRKQPKPKKDSHITWIQNNRADRKMPKTTAAKQDKQTQQDQWIGIQP